MEKTRLLILATKMDAPHAFRNGKFANGPASERWWQKIYRKIKKIRPDGVFSQSPTRTLGLPEWRMAWVLHRVKT